jgi:hypothetical protein
VICGTGGGVSTVKVSVKKPVPPEFVALMETKETPTLVGVPLINPLAVLSESPAGSPMALKLIGVLVPVIV